MFELGGILDEVDEEIDSASTGNPYLHRLSLQLEARIVALSLHLRPYRYIEVDSLTSRPLSPERGQLLVSLVQSYVLLNDIVRKSDFSYADLRGAPLSQDDLARYTYEFDTSHVDVRLKRGRRYLFPFRSYFEGGSFHHADFSGARLNAAVMDGSDLSNAVFRGSTLIGARFEGADLEDADFKDADLGGAELRGAQNLTWQQLCSAKRINHVCVDSTILQSFEVECKNKPEGKPLCLKDP